MGQSTEELRRQRDADFEQYRREAYASQDEEQVAAYERAAAFLRCAICGDRSHPDFWIHNKCQWCGAVRTNPAALEQGDGGD